MPDSPTGENTGQEAKAARGIDAATPKNPADAPRQAVQAPDRKLDKVSSYTGQAKQTKPGEPHHDTRATAGGQLEADDGVAENEKDPIE